MLTILFVAAFGALNGQDNYALLITGDYHATGISNTTEQWNSGIGLEPINGYNEFWNDTYLFWEMLYNKEFTNDKIHVLFADGEDYFESHTWVDNRYIPDEIPGVSNITDGLSSNTAISNKFSELANTITENDFLFVWVMSHGGTDATGSYFYSYDAQKIYDSQLAGWLNGINAHKKTVFLSFPSSGGFTDELEGDRTIVVTSSQENQAASRADNMSPGGIFTENEMWGTNTYNHGEFNYHLFSSLSGVTPFGETTYGAGNTPLTDADFNNDGFISIGESKTWDISQSTTTESQGFSDLSGIAEYTDFVIPTILHGSINTDMLIKGKCAITLPNANFINGNTVTIDGIVDFEIVKQDPGNLIMDVGSTTIISNDSEITIPSDNILIDGDLNFGDNVNYKTNLCSLVLNQKNDEIIKTLSFGNLNPNYYSALLDIQTTKYIEIGEGSNFSSGTKVIGRPTNVVIENSYFNASVVNFIDVLDRINKIKINSCFFETDFDPYDNLSTIYLSGYEDYKITNTEITNCGRDGITLEFCGYKVPYEAPRLIQFNNIFDNYNVHESCVGITISSSYCDIRDNKILRNNFGVVSYGNSKVLLEGNPEATDPDETQEIRSNTRIHVLSGDESSFPYLFKWNFVDVENDSEAEVYLTSPDKCKIHNITHNYWGEAFSSSNLDKYFYPKKCFEWFPKWELMQSNVILSEAEIAYSVANEQIERQNYSESKITLQNLVNDYPESEFADAALKNLLLIESELNLNYQNLITYFVTDSTILSNDHLSKLAKSLINKCFILDDDYYTALNNYNNDLNDSITYYDSIITLNHIDYVNYLIENSQSYKSSFSIEDYKAYAENDLTMQITSNHYKNLLLNPAYEDLQNQLEALSNGELLQSIPNPNKGNCKFYYKLFESGFVEINIYNNIGQLVDQENIGQKYAGIHFFNFQNYTLSEGMYFYTLKVNGIKTDTKKMVIKN